MSREYKAIWLIAPFQVRKVQKLDLLLIFLQTARKAHYLHFPPTRAAFPTDLLKKKIISCNSAFVSSLRAPGVGAKRKWSWLKADYILISRWLLEANSTVI